jgi:hypothetical protein
VSVRDVAEQIATSPKVAGSVSALTTGSGVGTVFDLIPNDIGKLATLIGIILSLVLIYTHWRRGRIQYEKARLEIAILREREAERIEAARRRREQHLDGRRSYDCAIEEDLDDPTLR